MQDQYEHDFHDLMPRGQIFALRLFWHAARLHFHLGTSFSHPFTYHSSADEAKTELFEKNRPDVNQLVADHGQGSHLQQALSKT